MASKAAITLTSRSFRVTTVAVGKNCVCVCVIVALVIQHVKCKRRIISSVACLAIPYFSTLSHKRHDFRNRVTEHKRWGFIFSTTFVCNISHSKKNSSRYYHKRI